MQLDGSIRTSGRTYFDALLEWRDWPGVCCVCVYIYIYIYLKFL